MINPSRPGCHFYNGRINGRGQRTRSKLYKGIKVNFRKLSKIFKQIENERKFVQSSNGRA
jgi:hypothetical protein